MNCKPGDLAIVIGGPVYGGRLVEVLYAAPVGVAHELPNGVTNAPNGEGCWVVKSMGTPFPKAIGDGMYGTGRDSNLRPLPGITEVNEHDEAVSA